MTPAQWYWVRKEWMQLGWFLAFVAICGTVYWVAA